MKYKSSQNKQKKINRLKKFPRWSLRRKMKRESLFFSRELKQKLFSSPHGRRKIEKNLFSFHRKCLIFLFFINEKSFFFMWKEKLRKISFLPSCKKRRKVESHLSSHLSTVTLKISRLSNLRLNEIVATTFNEKFKYLKKKFFSLNVDLHDINNFIPVNSLILTRSIKKEINKVIVKLKVDKTSKTNQILNRMLKILRKTMTKKLIFIFQACINVEYHFKSFRKAKIIIFKKVEKNNYTIFKVYKFIVLLNTINKMLKLIIINKITKFAKKICSF